MLSPVQVHNEWDPLEEVIVGIADNARVPSPDRGLLALDYADRCDTEEQIPTGPYDAQLLAEAAEDLAGFAAALESMDVKVRRPDVTDHAARFGTPDWRADGEYNYCPRDVLLVVGDTVIETPMALRTRYFESFAYRRILIEYFIAGANWIAAPKPMLLDEFYRVRPTIGPVLADDEPVFDAANVLRAGRDILYLVSSSGNPMGMRWLARVLGSEYRVHALTDIYDGTHLDTTVALIRPGLVVLNPSRVHPDRVPGFLETWDVIWCPPPRDTMPGVTGLRATPWMGMNLLMVTPALAIVDDSQPELARALERHGVDVLPLTLRHARALSGGFHCVSLDVRRRGTLEDYS